LGLANSGQCDQCQIRATLAQEAFEVSARKIIWEAVKVMVAAVIAAIVVEIFHDKGIYPDRWLIDETSDALSSRTSYYLLIVVIALPVLFAEHALGWLTKRPERHAISPPQADDGAKFESPLKIRVGDDREFEDIPKGSLYGFTRRLKFELKNDDSSKTAADCKVQITKIFPDPGYRGPWVLAEGFSLSPGDAAYIPVAQRGEGREPTKFDRSDTSIEICVPGNHPPLLPVEVENVLTLRATARDMPFREAKLVVWIDEGRLRIRAVATLARAVATPARASGVREKIPLWEASRRTFDECRDTRGGKIALGLNNSEDEIIGYYAYALAEKIPIYGTPPLSTKEQQVPLKLGSAQQRIEFRNCVGYAVSVFAGDLNNFQGLFVYEDDLAIAIEKIKSVI
jgi:hypothetical protein